MDATWPASAAVAILMIAQAQLARWQLGGWLAPGAFFSLAWTTATISCLLLAPEYRIWPGVLWVLFMTCTAHLGGALAPAERPGEPDLRQPVRQPPRFPLLLSLLCVSAALGIAGDFYLIRTVGKDFAYLLSLRGLGDVSSYFAGSRYSDETYREPAGFLALQTFVYFAGYLGGGVFAQSRSRIRRAVALAPMAPAMLGALLLGARSAAVAFGMCWIAAYCAIRAYAGDRAPWRSARRAYAAMALAMIAFTGFYVIIESVRKDLFAEGPAAWVVTRDKTIAYGLSSAKTQYVGYLAAFSTWFSQNWDVWQTPDFGVTSFSGPAGWLGYKVVHVHDEIQVSPSNAALTNIFSMFRHMAFDWTLPGSAVFLFLLSVLASIAYAKVRAGSVACIPFIALFYLVALYVTGFALQTTVTDVAWLMFAVYVWVACSRAPEPELSTARTGIEQYTSFDT